MIAYPQEDPPDAPKPGIVKRVVGVLAWCVFIPALWVRSKITGKSLALFFTLVLTAAANPQQWTVTDNIGRSGGAGVADWTPASLGTNLIGWWDAEDEATVTYDALGGITNRVRFWSDKSGSGRGASNTLGATAAPYFRPDSWTNGGTARNMIDWIRPSATALTFPVGKTLPTTNTSHIFVFLRESAGDNVIPFGSAAARPMPFRWNTVNLFYSMPTDGNPLAQRTNTMSGFFWVVQQYDGTNATIRLNGTNQVLAVSSSVNTFSAADSIGRGGTTDNRCFIGEAFVLGRNLTAEEITQIDNYIKTRWGF